MSKRTAVIDIGSNSVRMIIIEKTSRFAFHLLYEAKSRVRIAENAYQNGGELQVEAMKRTVLALKDFIQIAKSYDVRKTLCVATSAVRDASNKKQFLSRVHKELKLNVKVISGEREAYLGAIACANLLPPQDSMTLDIGGGSTEYASISGSKILAADSLDLGTVRLKELFFDHGDVKGAKAYIDTRLEELGIGHAEHITGVGGTFRALAQIILKSKKHPLHKLHAFRFDVEEIVSLGKSILNATDKESLKTLGIKKERHDVIRPGVLILLRIIKKVGAKELTCSGVGVREGLYLSDLLRHNRDIFPNNFNPSLTYLLDQHSHNAAQRNLRVKLTRRLFALLHQELELDAVYEKSLLTATKLAKIGASHDFYDYHKHSHYLTSTALSYGYSHQEIVLVSTLILCQQDKTLKKSYISEYQSLLPETETIRKMTYMMALADALLAHHPSQIDFDLSLEEKSLVVRSACPFSYLAQESVKAMHKSRVEVIFKTKRSDR